MTPAVRFQPTPNPNAGKFVVGRPVVDDDRARSYDTVEDADDAPLARALIALDAVTNVFMVEDFITVTKTPDASWDALMPEVERAIGEHLGE